MNTFTFYRSDVVRGAALVSLAALGLGVSASALANTATSNADATIVTALTLTNTQALDFGSVVAGTGGTVVMTAAGARSCTGDVTCAVQDDGLVSTFGVTGEDGLAYSITLPADGTITIEESGTATMAVDGFGDSIGGGGTIGTEDSFTVGATLTVGADQVVGPYTGTFDVTVNYD